MSMKTINANSESVMVREVPAAIHEAIVSPDEENSASLNTSRSILQSTLTVLGGGRISSQKRPDDDSALFDTRFSRSYRLLHFIACRILKDPEQAKKAVENCWHSASARAPRFEYEGAFRSWVVRVLIDEALPLLREKQQALETNISFKAAGPRPSRIGGAESNAQT
jgi:hypothetical protein